MGVILIGLARDAGGDTARSQVGAVGLRRVRLVGKHRIRAGPRPAAAEPLTATARFRNSTANPPISRVVSPFAVSAVKNSAFTSAPRSGEAKSSTASAISKPS